MTGSATCELNVHPKSRGSIASRRVRRTTNLRGPGSKEIVVLYLINDSLRRKARGGNVELASARAEALKSSKDAVVTGRLGNVGAATCRVQGRSGYIRISRPPCVPNIPHHNLSSSLPPACSSTAIQGCPKRAHRRICSAHELPHIPLSPIRCPGVSTDATFNSRC